MEKTTDIAARGNPFDLTANEAAPSSSSPGSNLSPAEEKLPPTADVDKNIDVDSTAKVDPATSAGTPSDAPATQPQVDTPATTGQSEQAGAAAPTTDSAPGGTQAAQPAGDNPALSTNADGEAVTDATPPPATDGAQVAPGPDVAGVGNEVSQHDAPPVEGATATTEAAASTPALGSLRLVIDDDIGHPIPNLPLKILLNDTIVFLGKSDATGEIYADKLPVGENLVIHVKTDNGDYKQVAVATIGRRENAGRLKSAKTRLEVTSMYHHGQPGQTTAEKEKIAKTHNQTPAPTPSVSGNQPQKPAVKTGRNDKGHPVAQVSYGLTDWFGLNRLRPLLWSVAEKSSKAQGQRTGSPGSGTNAGTAASTASGATSAPAPSPAQASNPMALEHLRKLIDFSEKHILLSYPDNLTSDNIVDMMRKKTLPAFPSKVITLSKQRCNKYVKVALAYAEYGINGAVVGSGVSPAQKMCPELLKAGFTDVTASFPKVKISTPQGEFEQANIVYAMPGDIVVYTKLANLNGDGHIDIRTYHGFISDFLWPGRGGFPDQTKYKVLGVYRQYSDVAARARIFAFLRIIRENETGGYAEPYKALRYVPSLGSKAHTMFDDFSKHPSNSAENKPAGAYQIKFTTYNAVAKEMGWPTDFDKAAQDRVAVALLQRRHESNASPTRSALGYILEGDVEKAINNTKLWNEWACLPGGGRQAHITMDEVKKKFAEYVKDFKE